MPHPTATDRVRAAYQRIRALDRPEIWISLREEQAALDDAAAIDARVAAGENLPLAGTVAGVKDNIDVAGLDTTAAAPSYRYRPESDATAVGRLRAAGAIVIGKTNLDQFATGLVGARSPYGAVRNAWRPDRISGGSSSGSAVAVALGIVDVALGTDTAGSGRVPAALNGIIGLKLTRGRIPTTGVVPACRTLDCVTVFARDLATARQTAELLAGPDGADPLARTDAEARQHLPSVGLPARPRVGVPAADQLEGLAPGWSDAFRDAANRLAATGVDVVDVDIEPLLQAAKMLYDGAFVAERYAAVGAHIDSHRELIGTDLDPSVAAIVLGGADRTAVELFQDREELDRLAALARDALAGCDALLTPTTTWHPTFDELAADPIGGNSRMGRYTNFANLLDMTSLAIPAGTVDGAPFGVMFTAAAFRDGAVQQLAERFLAPALEVLVVGAHLTDQPLNHQLVAAGGTLVGSATTSADYALFALDTTPPKPGLLRVERAGSAIVGEVWSLPAAGFGAFVAGLPAPMTIGSVLLADGRRVPGFLCEAVATIGAKNISGHGGWLAWLRS
ncbi:allophanate hydrolase [Cryobacterium sp.]|jgi:allophanate hydrolase|uniref:allophanate hydrolase n=1 Tax=Cryobacterium sp. TaxID=1926290 RepID=UPI0026034CED|nr:allophanate hydrolase [Cryobacterium sp.]MCU1446692.1 allophanate hydrolase [Cryobacterium sp.]